MATNASDALQDEFTRKLQELNERVAEYDRLIEHAKRHDCSKEKWTEEWSAQHYAALKSDNGRWFYEWDSTMSTYDGKTRSQPGPTADEARRLNADAAYAFAKQIQEQGVKKFAELASVHFAFGLLTFYRQT